MGRKKHKNNVRLAREERSYLIRLTLGGVMSVRKLNRVKILLLADENHEQGHKTDQEIVEKLDTSTATINRIRRRYAEEGLEAAIGEKPRSGRPPTISGEQRAHITALACSEPPTGYSQWSLRLLADKAVELELIESLSHHAVGQILKKTRSNPTSCASGAWAN